MITLLPPDNVYVIKTQQKLHNEQPSGHAVKRPKVSIAILYKKNSWYAGFNRFCPLSVVLPIIRAHMGGCRVTSTENPTEKDRLVLKHQRVCRFPCEDNNVSFMHVQPLCLRA